MNLQNRVFRESELHELNDLREYSLLKFYNVSLKSMYSNITHVVRLASCSSRGSRISTAAATTKTS